MPRVTRPAGSRKGSTMRKVAAFSLTLALALTALAAVPAGSADNLKPCNQSEVILGGTYGNVFVPAGGTCILENVTVTGNFRAVGAAEAQVIFSRVSGDVVVEDTPVAQVGWSKISGDVRFERNGESDTLSWAIRGSDIGGDCFAKENVGSRDVNGNLVEGAVRGQCKPQEWLIGTDLGSR